MDELLENYRKLNPFVQNSVGENVIWGSDDNYFCDVESINESAFKALLSGIESVNDDGQTRSLFLVGSAGAGKSHLFARLRRKLANGQFTFVSNPSRTVSHIKRSVLNKVVYGMREPVMGPEGPLPYSQLQRMVYSLLQRLLRGRDLAINQIHERWTRISRTKCEQNLSRLEGALARIVGLRIPIDVRRVLVRTIDEERCDLATSWLSGNQNLSDTDHRCLGVAGPLGDDQVSVLMKHFGHLSFGSGPIVLILDQLDSLEQPDQIREIESLMIDLNDSSRNWYLIVSLVHEKFDLWLSTLSMPFQQRFGAVTGDSVSLVTAELSGLSEEQRRQLIIARLGTPGLTSQRKTDGVDDLYYPVSHSAIQELTCSDISEPRKLIQKGMETYIAAVNGSTQVPKITLLEFIGRSFADLRVELQEEELAVETAYLADRVEELFGLLWSVKASARLEGTSGSLHTDLPNFEGIDKIYTCGDRPVRVVLYDVQQRNKFPSVLRRIVNAHTNTILLRDGRISISGRATKEKLDLFQKDKKFFHLSLDEIKTLHAMGSLLARMREGEFENQDTEPKATESAIYECLAQQNDLAETDLAQAFLAMAGLADLAEGNHPSETDEKISNESDDLAPDDPLVLGVAELMEKERWMSFERLCVRINSTGITADPPKIYRCVKNRPISESLMVYPRDVNLLEAIGIVIWSREE